VLRKVYFKYLLIRVRAKISYIAMYKRMTVLELFVRTIRKCYLDLIKKNEIPKPDEEIAKRNQQVVLTLMERGYRGHIVTLIHYNLHKAEEKEDMAWLRQRLNLVKRRIDHKTKFESADGFLDMNFACRIE
jgi:hypothetical protein